MFGAPHQFFTDDGGEFSNEKMIALADRFGIKLLDTAAESHRVQPAITEGKASSTGERRGRFLSVFILRHPLGCVRVISVKL